MRLLEQAVQPVVLNQAWKLLRNEHTPWSVTVNRDQLQRDLVLHLLEVSVHADTQHFFQN